MNDFEASLSRFVEESAALQKRELALQQEGQLFMQKWMGFMKENGLPENFTLPELAALAVKKSRSLIVAP